jgi:hypothetical protein
MSVHPPPPRGKQPRNRLPKEENERIIEETIRRIRGMTFPLSSVSGGSSTSSGFATYTPIIIAAGETFTVPTNTQMLYAIPIQNDGTLIVDGELVEVD